MFRALLLGWVLAQVAAGEITGIVKDGAGGAVPGATITVTDVATNRQRVIVSSRDGIYTAPSLPPGEYRVYSWEEAEFGAWMDPDFMKPQESRGEAVSIQEGARQAVQVNLIPADSQ